MKTLEDDELEDVKPAVAVEEEEETPKAAATKAKNATKAVAKTEDLDAGWDDEELSKQGDGLERLKPEKGRVVRFALIEFAPLKAAWQHYIKGKGFFRCLTDHKNNGEIRVCCEGKIDEAYKHAVALAFHYTNANPQDGSMKKDQPIEWDIKYVDLSNSNFRSIKSLPEEEKTPYSMDIAMGLEGKKYTFACKLRTPRWLQNPELVEEVKAKIAPYLKDDAKILVRKLGKQISAEEFKLMIAGLGRGAEDATLENVEEL